MIVVPADVSGTMIHVSVSPVILSVEVWIYGSTGSLWLFHSSGRAWNPQVRIAGLGRPFLLGLRWNQSIFYVFVLSGTFLSFFKIKCIVRAICHHFIILIKKF